MFASEIHRIRAHEKLFKRKTRSAGGVPGDRVFARRSLALILELSGREEKKRVFECALSEDKLI